MTSEHDLISMDPGRILYGISTMKPQESHGLVYYRQFEYLFNGLFGQKQRQFNATH